MVNLIRGQNAGNKSQGLEDPVRQSYGPTKDAILGAHTNLAYVEDYLAQIAAYLLGR